MAWSGRSFVLALAFALLLGVTACASPTKMAQEALNSTPAVPQAVGDTGAQKAVTPGVSTPLPTAVQAQATASSQPTAKPTAVPQDLRVIAKGYGQSGRQVGVAFIVENPNQALAVESSSYQIALYDSAGAVLKSDQSYLELLLPGQKLGVGAVLFLDSDSAKVAKVDVQVKPGRFSSAEAQPGFATDKVTYVPDKYYPKTTGVIKSPYKADIAMVRVSAVAYDKAGAIIGGGFTYVSFVPAEGQAGVEVSVVTAGTPARVELHPSITSLSILDAAASKASASGQAAEAKPITIVSKGWGKQEQTIGYGFIVENPNASLAVESSSYQVAAYDAAGNVLGTTSSYIDLLLPGQRIGVGGDLLLDKEDAKVDRVDVQVKPGRYSTSEPQQSLTADKVRYVDDKYSPHVAGVIKSPYKVAVKHLRASAIAYDAKGAIIGGGYAYLDFALPTSPAPVEVTTHASAKPAKVELYATLSSLSALDQQAEPPTGSEPVRVSAKGFAKSDRGAGYGFVLENPNTKLSVEGSAFSVAAYDAEGNVLAVETGTVALLLPGQKIGFGDSMSVAPDNAKIAKLDVQVLPGSYADSEAQSTFTAEKVKVVTNTYSTKATAVIKSPYQKDIKQVRVAAVSYDASGAIVGGGYTYVDFVPANGQAAVEISLSGATKPARVEVYPAISGLSTLE